MVSRSPCRRAEICGQTPIGMNEKSSTCSGFISTDTHFSAASSCLRGGKGIRFARIILRVRLKWGSSNCRRRNWS